MKLKIMRWLGLAGFVAVCLLAAGIGSWLTAPNVGEWYQQLHKPSWTPPDWGFGPVWTMLYLTMAVAAWLVWQKHGWSRAPIALGLFAGQLLLNVAWSGVFFGLKQPGAAFAELLVLWLAILATTIAFWRKQAVAGLLLLPYGAWVTFAGVLNFAIWQLNR